MVARRNNKKQDDAPIQRGVFYTLDALTPHPENYNHHPETQVGDLCASLTEFGQVDDIIVWPHTDGGRALTYIVGGEGIWTAAGRLDMPGLFCTVLPATWPYVKVKRYLIANNTLSRHADPDMTQLAAMLEEQRAAGYHLESLGFSDDDLTALLDQLADDALAQGSHDVDDPDGGGDDFDTTPDESGPTRTQPGDLWKLGNHRLLCGDSTKREDVARLMAGETAQMVWSDPPYGVSIVSTDGMSDFAVGTPFGGVKAQRLGATDGSKPFGHVGAGNVVPTTAYMPVIGDDSTQTAHASYRLYSEIAPKAVQIWWGANYYTDVLPPSSGWIVWDKRSNGETDMTSNNFADCELAWLSNGGPARIFRHIWNGMIRSSEHQKRVHPTQKPVALAAWAFEKYGATDDIVLDPFCGSGMSMIAGERVGRSVYALEMSADYCDVILRRWEAETGREVVLLERLTERE